MKVRGHQAGQHWRKGIGCNTDTFIAVSPGRQFSEGKDGAKVSPEGSRNPTFGEG